MRRKPFISVPFDRLDAVDGENCTNWIWDGYLARGNITLLTSLWKAGKTTLLAGLLERLGSGGSFLDHACGSARALVVSEESREHWAERRRLFPIGPHAELITRPFLTRPSPRQWSDLIDHALRLRGKKRLDLFVVDPLASFLPGHSESDPGTLLTMLQPLQMLAGRGVAVLILHHPRKEASEEGSTARGSGALLGYVDIILELHRFSRSFTDASTASTSRQSDSHALRSAGDIAARLAGSRTEAIDGASGNDRCRPTCVGVTSASSVGIVAGWPSSNKERRMIDFAG